MNFDGHGVTIAYARGGGRPVIDATGTHMLVMRDCTISAGNPENLASCGILLARPLNGDSAGLHYFENVTVGDYYSVAPVVNIGSESNEWMHCYFNNFGGSRVAYIATTIVPPGINGANPGTGGLLCQVFTNSHWFVEGGTPRKGIGIIIQSPKTSVLGDILIQGGTFSIGKGKDGKGRGECGIKVDGPDAVIRQVTLDTVRFECEQAINGIDKTPRTRPWNWSIKNCTINAEQSAIRWTGDAADRINGLKLENNTFVSFSTEPWGHVQQGGTIDNALRPAVDIGYATNCTLDTSGIIYETQKFDGKKAISWPVNRCLRIGTEAKSCDIKIDAGRDMITKRTDGTLSVVKP